MDMTVTAQDRRLVEGMSVLLADDRRVDFTVLSVGQIGTSA
jgi:hypothetical protein